MAFLKVTIILQDVLYTSCWIKDEQPIVGDCLQHSGWGRTHSGVRRPALGEVTIRSKKEHYRMY
jgi:hypothetical protein